MHSSAQATISTLDGSAPARSPAAKASIALASGDGSVVKLSDVATVEDSFKEQSYFVTINEERGAIVMVQKQSGANTVQVARAVRERMVELKKRLPPDVRIVNVMDSSERIERAVGDLSNNLLAGGAPRNVVAEIRGSVCFTFFK